MQKPLIFFDLGGVLLLEASSSPKKLTKHLHINIFLRTFEFASLFLGSNCKDKWFLGEISSNDVLQAINSNIDLPQYISFFEDTDERDFIKYECHSFLILNTAVENTHIIPEGLEFVKQCKTQGIKMGIISNWEKPSFELIRAKFPELFNFFDEQATIIPAKAGCTKPSPFIYELSLKAVNREAASCIFIDDNMSNVTAAQKYGIPSILHKNWDETKQAIKALGLNL
jgi:FMN phosphatase YigB (HAD superfamily)